jgi:putative peptidoglycan lipid II flippase
MERILRIFGREYGSINQAALLLGSFAILSQVLGLVRDRSIAHFIGPGSMLDAYYAAFRIPDLIFISIASLASVTVIVPFVIAKVSEGKVTEEARKFLNEVFTVFFTLMVSVAVVAFFILPHLMFIVAPGLSPMIQEKIILLSRIMLLSPILMGLSNLFGAVSQLYRKFVIYSLSPILYNLGIIVGVIFLYPIFDIYGLAIGVVLGAFLHFMVQAFASESCGFTPRFSVTINFSEIRKVVMTSLPRTLGLAFNNIALIAIVALASFLKPGSISIFNLSLNLQSVPLNIIGISYSVAAFPTLAKAFSVGKMDDFKTYLKSSARSIVFWSIPVTFLFIVLRAQIVRTILGSPSFSWDNTRLVAASLAIFSVSVLAQGMIALISRAYYAKGETKRPLIVNMISSILIILLAFFLTYIFNHSLVFRYFVESLLKVSDISGTEVLMLPLAYSLGTIFNFLLHWYFLKQDFLKGEPFIVKTFFQSLGASFFLGVVSYVSLNAFSPIFGTDTFLGIFLQGFLSGLLGIAACIFVLHILQNEELKELTKTLNTKFWRAKVVAPAQEGL